MIDPKSNDSTALSLPHERAINAVCLRFENAWQEDESPRIEDYLAEIPEIAKPTALAELIALEVDLRRGAGQIVYAAEYGERFPHGATEVDAAFQLLQRPQKTALVSVATDPPEVIGRYRVERLLGAGGFGRVFLAYDSQLHRYVAVKVPHAQLVARSEDVEAYLSEARTVANLDHPNIVPVYDAGETDEILCYIVSKYVEGNSLDVHIKKDLRPRLEPHALVATLASALHYAHRNRVVHRDIKPGNVLINKSGQPFIVDFGLALRDNDADRRLQYAGTPAYMSPEQARGEGHRVDGRSDVFSLGVMFYELLVGRRPFSARSHSEVLNQIITSEPRPPRRVNSAIPRQLERICLKALSKRAADRYSTAKEMADDLRHFAEREDDSGSSLATPNHHAFADPSAAVVETAPAGTTPANTPASDDGPIRIVPKGLRPFDEHDADFFLELLPGPRDRHGLPESIRFWKHRIEEQDSEKTFSVGLIYGPSGCGKTSFVKAGLLPLFRKDVTPVFVEATSDGTEARILNGLLTIHPNLPRERGLKDAVTAIRRGNAMPHGQKVVIILDQFEQWLHANSGTKNSELAQALRQCDGGRVQCVVLVRDDFWLAMIRFMQEIEVEIRQDENSALVDLFDRDHARKVLIAFGRAFKRLPVADRDITRDQNLFLDRVIDGLETNGAVICVRLAIFAEMMKGKPWSTDVLRKTGGMDGVGVAFLEDTFCSATAPPTHRAHHTAACQILELLLPESGTHIKGRTRTRAELLVASGYDKRPKDFATLLRILDTEVRLITPVDPEGTRSDNTDDAAASITDYHYQLSHDCLIPVLRDWMARKRRETRRGRAELLLTEHTADWSVKPKNRHLPSAWEALKIFCFTDRRRWDDSQTNMMRHCLWVRGTRILGVAVPGLIALVMLVVWWLTPGDLMLNVQPVGATIAIGNRQFQAEAEPLSIKLHPGVYDVEVRSPNHSPEHREVSVRRAQSKELTLKLDHHQGHLDAECEPFQSLIVIDDTPYGSRLRNHALDTGEHTLSAWAPGCFEALERKILIRKDETFKTRFSLDEGWVWQYKGMDVQSGFHLLPDLNGDGAVEICGDFLATNRIFSGKDGKELITVPGPTDVRRRLRRMELGGRIGDVLVLVGREKVGQEVFTRVYCAPIDRPDQPLWDNRIADRQIDQAPGKPAPWVAVSSLLDVTGDGVREICTSAMDGRVHILDGRSGKLARTLAAIETTESWTAAFTSFEVDDHGYLLCVFDNFFRVSQPMCHVVAYDLATMDQSWSLPPGELSRTGCCDFDGDAVPEVICYSDTRWEILDARSGNRRWRGTFPGPVEDRKPFGDTYLTPLTADIDEDGVSELVVVYADPSLPLVAIRLSTGEVIWSGPKEVVFAASHSDGRLMRTNRGHFLIQTKGALKAIEVRTGRTVWSFPGKANRYVCGDLDGDGQREIVLSLIEQGLVCLNEDGQLQWSLRLDVDVIPANIIPDADRDGLKEILVYKTGSLLGMVRSPRVLWTATANGPLLAKPLLADCDNDGSPEVIQIGQWPDTHDVRCLDGRNGCERWSHYWNIPPNQTPSLVDWNSDGLQELAVVRTSEVEGLEVIVIRTADGSVAESHTCGGSRPYATPTLVDLNGDRSLDAVFQLWDNLFIATDGKNKSTSWEYKTAGKNMGGFAVLDIDGDDLPDVIGPSGDGFLYALRGTDGDLLWKAEAGGYSTPLITDLGNDGAQEVLIVSSDWSGDEKKPSYLHVFDAATGNATWTTTVDGSSRSRSHVAAVRRGNSNWLIASFGDGGVAAFDFATRQQIWNSLKDTPVTNSPVVADLDRDTKQEVVVATRDGQLVVLDLLTGKLLWTVRITDEYKITADPTVADLNGDGILDILIANRGFQLTAISGHCTVGARNCER